MKFAISLAALGFLAAAAVGCQDKKPAATMPTASVTQLTPAQADAATPAPAAYTPAPATADPAVSAAAPIDTATPSAAAPNPPLMSTASFGGTKYTIKPGDNLYRIAVSHYGDGKQWRKIADANPGVTPSHLKVGQSITLP